MEQKYFKVGEIAKMFGMHPATVREKCHADGQLFAFQPVPRGNILIDIKKFEEFMKGSRPDHRRRMRR